MKILTGSKEYINKSIDQLGCEIIYNEKGKPLDKEGKIFFNKSHTKDLSVAIIDDRECGIDVEYIRTYNDLLAKKICSKDEYKFLQNSNNKDYDFTLLWVLKESYVKCIGIGISYPFKDISFIKDNKLITKIDNYTFKIKNKNNHIIAICRKD